MDGGEVAWNRKSFIRTEYISQLGRPKTMMFKKTYPRDTEVLSMHFNIRPYDILILTSFSEVDLNQSIVISLGLFVWRSFTDTSDSFETSILYVVSIFRDQTAERSTHRNSRDRTDRNIFHTHVLWHKGTIQRCNTHLRDIQMSDYYHFFDLLTGWIL